MTTVKCKECGAKVPPHVQNCITCGQHVGFPNVRAAEEADEQKALADRVKAAFVSAGAGGYSATLSDFGRAVQQSNAVLARNLNMLDRLVNSENHLLLTYHQAFRAGERLPEDNFWDKGRVAADSTINPNYYLDIHFAALSLDYNGVKIFGEYSVTLKQSVIAKRSTVFEENGFVFCDHHKIAAGSPAPVGYRATWDRRDQLAQAKLFFKLTPTMPQSDFPGVLLKDGVSGAATGVDFIEVHVYGPLHRTAIERVIGPSPKSGPQKAIWRSIKRELKRLGVVVKEL